MAGDVPKAKPQSSAPWSDKEFAFLLNHADYCIQNNQDYSSTIVDALSNFTSAQRRSASSVYNKLRWCLSKNGEDTSASKFRQQGTTYLRLKSLPPGVSHEMASQRETLGLEALDLTDPLPTAAGDDTMDPSLDGPASADNDYWKRNSACNADGRRKTYCEDSDDDSGSPGSATSMGSEFTGETPKKPVRGKAHLIVHPPSDPKSVKQTLAKKESRPAHPSQGSHILPNSTQSQDTMPPANKGSTTRKSIDIDADEEVTAQNGSDKDSRPPRKRQRSCENERFSSPTTSEHSTVSEQVGVCPETPQPKLASIAPLEKRRVTLFRLPPSVSKKPDYRPCVEKSPTQQLGGTMQQSQDSRQQQEDLRQQVEVLRQQQEETNNVLFQLYREWDPTGRKKLPEMSQRLTLIARTMQKEPGSLAERVLEDVASLSHSNEKFRKTLKNLVGYQDDRTFPVHPLTRDVDGGWRRLQKEFRDAIVYGHPHDSQLPDAWVAGYLASQTSHLLKDKNAALDLASYIEELEVPLDNLHAVLNLVSALLCSWMFATPDAFCSELYSKKELKIYETILVIDGPSAVQKTDKMGATLMFNDETDPLQNNRLAKQVSSLEHNLLEALHTCSPNAPGLDPEYGSREWLQDALKFKHSLLLSPKDYRVHFCLPGTPYDESWMAAEDVFGIPLLKESETNGKRVIMCLFPALVEIEAVPFGEHVEVEEVLISNKRFFPTAAERRAFDPTTVVSKACVLLG